MTKPRVALCWFPADGWDETKRLFADPDDLQASHDEWLKSAGKVVAALKKQGFQVTRVPFDPVSFAAFRAANPDIQANGKGRSSWAAHRLSQMIQQGETDI